jgi:hypothetical protein
MRNTMLSLLALVCMAQFPAEAQSAAYEHYINDVDRRGPVSRVVGDQFDPPIDKRKEAKYKEHEFRSKTQAFVDLWSALAREYSQKGTFNMKIAKDVSKAFHALEKCEGWPKVDRR